MKLPGAERCLVDPAKVRDYLLSQSHPVGRFKARFFFALGYAAETSETLVLELLHHAARGAVRPTEITAYGQKFEVRGTIVGPNGRAAEVVAIWIVLSGEDAPRFVTAFPG